MVAKHLGHTVPFKHTCYDYCTPIIFSVVMITSLSECEESCVARYRHVHLSLDFTSQEFGIEPNVSKTIQSSSSVAIQFRGDVRLSTLWGGEMAGNQWE